MIALLAFFLDLEPSLAADLTIMYARLKEFFIDNLLVRVHHID
jgi:hypothetical protein